MKKYLPIALALAALATAGATPVFAQTMGPTYDYVPFSASPSSIYDPAVTGGGSSGYNELAAPPNGY